MIDKKRVLELIDERIAELDNGLFVVDLSISETNVIQVELDKYQGNVSVMDCVSVSRNVEHNLDREEVDFELHVSSAGIDRPLRVLPQFVKNIGRTVSVKLNDGTIREGVLKQVDEQTLELEETIVRKIEGKKKKETVVETNALPMNTIKETKIVISFK